MKKVLLLLLTLTLILSPILLASCNEKKETTDETKAKEKETTSQEDLYLDDLPDNLTFDNAEVKYLIADTGSGSGAFSTRSIGLENYTYGDNSVDDAVYNRNTVVEERLKVVISTNSMLGAILTSNVYTDLQSGIGEYDIISGYMAHDIALASQGLILDANTLDDYDADYIDIKNCYWSTDYINEITHNNILYWMTGDLSLRYLGGMCCTFVNTELYTNAIEGKTSSELGKVYPDIYTLVKNKEWNMDTMAEMCKMVFNDCGTTTDKVDLSDTYGFTCRIWEVDMFAVGAGVHFSERDPGGNVFITLNTDNEEAISFIDKFYQLYYKSGNCYVAPTINSEEYNPLNYFAQGNCLFCGSTIGGAEVYLTDMENYGIIPIPMLDENQTEYYTDIWDDISLYGFYIGCRNLPASSATMEAMAALSYSEVTPKYYDIALKYRYTRDENSAEMIDLLRSTVYVDFAYAWGNSINSIHNAFRTLCTKPYSASTLKSYTKIYEGKLDELLLKLEEVAEQASK